MVKSELITAITREIGNLPYKEMEPYVNEILESMSETLAQGGRIEIRGFGSFNLHHHPPRKAHNPKTKECMITEGKYSPHFKPGKELREQINANRHKPLVHNDEAKIDDI